MTVLENLLLITAIVLVLSNAYFIWLWRCSEADLDKILGPDGIIMEIPARRDDWSGVYGTAGDSAKSN